jgi:hypothetical protein
MLKIVLVLLVAGAIAGCEGLRVQEGIYANLTEARDAGAIAHGWVPTGLPPSTSDLREGHMPDARHWGVFTFAVADASAVRALLNTEITAGSPPCDPPGRLEWWPRILHTPVDVDRLHTTEFRLYRGKDGSMFAINWNEGRAYYWKA